MIHVVTEEILTIDKDSYSRDAILEILADYKGIKIGILENGSVVSILSYRDILEERSVPIKYLVHSKYVFDEALAEFRKYENRDELCIPVYNSDRSTLEYILQYKKNRVDEREQGYVREFLNYNIEDEFIDLEFINRADTFIFYELEEYTYQIARIILKNYPQKQICFLSEKAKFFFEDEKHVLINSIGKLYLEHNEIFCQSTMFIDSNKQFGEHNPMRFLKKDFHSLEIMTSLFWSCQRLELGTDNEEKTYLWIHCKLGNEHGFTDLIKYPLFKVIAALKKGIIPVIDLSVPGDRTHFSYGNGDNIWEFYMEQPARISVEEVKKNKNVIVHDCEIMDRFNPYNMEVEYFVNWNEMLEKYLKLNKETEEYIEQQCKKYIDETESILGVIGHPPHFGSGLNEYRIMEMKPFFEKVKEEFVKGNYDKIFLNTESEEVFQLFIESELGSKVIFIPQRRTRKEEFIKNDQMVSVDEESQIIAGNENLCERERRYLSIIYILSKCQMLISSTNCGALRLANALHKGENQNIWVYEAK